MAESAEIVMFPRLRRSELEKRAAEKKEAFEKSQAELIHTLQKNLKPLTFIKSHPKLLLGAFFTFFSSSKILFGLTKSVLFKKKSSIFWKLLKAGWLWKGVKVGLGVALKKNRPKIEELIQTFIKSLFTSKSRKN